MQAMEEAAVLGQGPNVIGNLFDVKEDEENEPPLKKALTLTRR